MSGISSGQLIQALRHFKYDIRQALQTRVEVYEERRISLDKALEAHDFDQDIAIQAVKILEDKLFLAQRRLQEKPDNTESQGEFRYSEVSLQIGQAKVEVYEKKRKETLGQWQAHMQMVMEKKKAQRLLEDLIDSEDNDTKTVCMYVVVSFMTFNFFYKGLIIILKVCIG